MERRRSVLLQVLAQGRRSAACPRSPGQGRGSHELERQRYHRQRSLLRLSQGRADSGVDGVQLVVQVVHDVLKVDAEAVLLLLGLVVALRRLHAVVDVPRGGLLVEGGVECPGVERVTPGVHVEVELGRLRRELDLERMGVVQW